MKIYLVGGAVRDELLGITPKEKDYVVVGSTVEEMLQQGFKQVGKDFPVFLHPETKEEYALARVERKVGKGYTGFTFDTSKKVTLEEDLKRRDLTINAIAKDETGKMIDPYHGVEDLKKKILRHVSQAFIEDPVRILRIARFAARFPDFTVADETVALMKKMVENGEVDSLVAERVWKEFEKALQEKNTEKFFEVLSSCNALAVLFPENISIETLEKSQGATPQTKFAVLFHKLSEDKIKSFCERYRVPTEYRDLALITSKYLQAYQDAKSPNKILELLQSTDAFRREERFKNFLTACEISNNKNSNDFLLKCLEVAKTIDMQKILNEKLQGKEIEKKIRDARLEKIKNSINIRS